MIVALFVKVSNNQGYPRNDKTLCPFFNQNDLFYITMIRTMLKCFYGYR